jgi:YHS domain-containing protein
MFSTSTFNRFNLVFMVKKSFQQAAIFFFLVFALSQTALAQSGIAGRLGLQEQDLASRYDPVCGMEAFNNLVDTAVIDGKIYGFCTAACKANFVKNPAQYTASVSSGTELRRVASADYVDSINAGLITQDTLKGSVQRITEQRLGNTTIRIRYSSPGTRGRIIWGGLVPFDAVWVTGAHRATAITFSREVSIGGQLIQPGTYALFTIPGKDKWTVILNRNHDQHLTDDYRADLDVLRLEVQPGKTITTVPRLVYQIEMTSANAARISMSWDDLIIYIPVTLQP